MDLSTAHESRDDLHVSKNQGQLQQTSEYNSNNLSQYANSNCNKIESDAGNAVLQIQKTENVVIPSVDRTSSVMHAGSLVQENNQAPPCNQSISRNVMDLSVHVKRSLAARTIFEDAEYFSKNYSYKLMPITFETVNEKIIHIEHNYCHWVSSDGEAGEADENLNTTTVLHSEAGERNYKKRKSKVPGETNCRVSDNDRSVEETKESAQDLNIPTKPEESIVNSCKSEETKPMQPLDLSLSLHPEHKTDKMLKESQANIPKVNRSEVNNIQDSKQFSVSESNKENVTGPCKKIEVTISRPGHRGYYQPGEIFLNDIARISPDLIKNDCYEIDIIDRTHSQDLETDKCRTYYIVSEATWRIFENSTERIILTNDLNIGQPIQNKERFDKPTFLIFDQCSLTESLAKICEVKGGSFEYTCLEECKDVISRVPEGRRELQVKDCDNSESGMSKVVNLEQGNYSSRLESWKCNGQKTEDKSEKERAVGGKRESGDIKPPGLTNYVESNILHQLLSHKSTGFHVVDKLMRSEFVARKPDAVASTNDKRSDTDICDQKTAEKIGMGSERMEGLAKEETCVSLTSPSVPKESADKTKEERSDGIYYEKIEEKQRTEENTKDDLKGERQGKDGGDSIQGGCETSGGEKLDKSEGGAIVEETKYDVISEEKSGDRTDTCENTVKEETANMEEEDISHEKTYVCEEETFARIEEVLHERSETKINKDNKGEVVEAITSQAKAEEAVEDFRERTVVETMKKSEEIPKSEEIESTVVDKQEADAEETKYFQGSEDVMTKSSAEVNEYQGTAECNANETDGVSTVTGVPTELEIKTNIKDNRAEAKSEEEWNTNPSYVEKCEIDDKVCDNLENAVAENGMTTPESHPVLDRKVEEQTLSVSKTVPKEIVNANDDDAELPDGDVTTGLAKNRKEAKEVKSEFGKSGRTKARNKRGRSGSGSAKAKITAKKGVDDGEREGVAKKRVRGESGKRKVRRAKKEDVKEDSGPMQKKRKNSTRTQSTEEEPSRKMRMSVRKDNAKTIDKVVKRGRPSCTSNRTKDAPKKRNRSVFQAEEEVTIIVAKKKKTTVSKEGVDKRGKRSKATATRAVVVKKKETVGNVEKKSRKGAGKRETAGGVEKKPTRIAVTGGACSGSGNTAREKKIGPKKVIVTARATKRKGRPRKQ